MYQVFIIDRDVTNQDQEHATFPLPREGDKTTIVDYNWTTYQIRQVNYLKQVTAGFSQIHNINHIIANHTKVGFKVNVPGVNHGYSKVTSTKARLSKEALVNDVDKRK